MFTLEGWNPNERDCWMNFSKMRDGFIKTSRIWQVLDRNAVLLIRLL